MTALGDERLPARFWAKVAEATDSDCWQWTASTYNGYGKLSTAYGKPAAYAHRMAHEALIGPIPDGFQVDHLCRNRSCVNPAHLEAVTPAENTRRAHLKPTCARGHQRTEGDGRCRECERMHSRERWQKTKARTRGEATLGGAG